MKKRVLSGIRATGRLHLGNYLGAVKGMLALAHDPDYETLYMVADVHAITTPYDVAKLRDNRLEVVKDYLAAGLDPEKSVIFLQSDVPEHLELAFYFSSVMSIARMQHLPTFKEKVKQYPDQATMALLNYPVLMAADILIYKAQAVPTGIDQEPHLEIAREVARKMNEKYGLHFPEPVRFATSGEYIPSLTGEGKMSKTVKGSYIELTDGLEAIRERLAKVPTDGGQGECVPESGGVAALLKLVELFEGHEVRVEYEERYVNKGLKYKEVKEELAETIYEELVPIQEKRRELDEDMGSVVEVVTRGAEKAGKIARETMSEVREVMGLGGN